MKEPERALEQLRQPKRYRTWFLGRRRVAFARKDGRRWLFKEFHPEEVRRPRRLRIFNETVADPVAELDAAVAAAVDLCPEDRDLDLEWMDITANIAGMAGNERALEGARLESLIEKFDTFLSQFPPQQEQLQRRLEGISVALKLIPDVRG